MKKDKQTRRKLLESAKKEFMEKGYTASSLRSICREANVTTGALYFFFQDKEDLFSSLVSAPLKELMATIESHYQEELEYSGPEVNVDFKSNIDVAREVVELLYRYKDEFILLLTKAQGTKYENCLDLVIDMTEKHYRHYADHVSQQTHGKKVDDYIIHWIAHIQIETFAQFLTHGLEKEEAIRQLDALILFIVRGWETLF